MPEAISKNQYDYLNNLVQAGGGNGEWAKAQLANSVYAPESPKTVTAAATSNTTPPSPAQTATVARTSTAPVYAPAAPSTPAAPDYAKQNAELLGKISSYMAQPMTYDPNSDAAYQAYKQSVTAGAKGASQAALETLNSRGILSSSITRDDISDIEQQYAQQAAAAIPQFQQQAYQRNRDLINDTFNLLQNSQNQQQRGIENANVDRNFGISQGQLTGYYSPDAATIESVQKQMAANSAAYASASPEEQRRLHEENVRLAATIGGKDTTGSGDYAYSPMRTVQGQQLDINQANEDRNFGLNQTQTLAQLTGYLPDGTPTNTKQQQDLQNLWLVAQQTGSIPDQLAELYGLPRGTKTQAAVQQAIENSRADRQLNATLANMSSDNARAAAAEARAAGNQNQAALFDIWDRTGVAPAGIPGVAPGTPLRDRASGSSAKTTDYKTDPNFADDVAYLKSNPSEAEKLDSHAQEFINQYGYDGYIALRKAAGLD